MIQVMVVDDSAVVRRLVTRALDAEPDIEVMTTAFDGQAAVEKLTRVQPDIIVLDIEMPRLNGLDALREIRRTHPKLPVVMFSTLTERGAEATLEALNRGASDYVAKPSVRGGGGIAEAEQIVRTDLAPKLRVLTGRSRSGNRPARATGERPGARPMAHKLPATPTFRTRQHITRPTLLVIGASTGGPTALATFLELLPVQPVPIAIVQHMPPTFTRMFAERLDGRSPHQVSEAQHLQPLRAGEVVVAPGGRHLELFLDAGDLRCRLTDAPPENSCRPAVDVLFRSVVPVAGSGVLGVVLTGMGEDGMRGGQEIVEAGGEILIQDEATSVVWGMPGAVARAGIATAQFPLERLPEAVTTRTSRVGAVRR